MMIEYVLHHNNAPRMKKYPKDEFMIPKKIELVPIKLWNHGMKHRTGKLRWGDSADGNIVSIQIAYSRPSPSPDRAMKFLYGGK